MSMYKNSLSKEEWAKHYNIKNLESVIQSINNSSVQPWAEKLVDIIPVNAKCLEIGCGTGISSLWLAKQGRSVTALDYTEESIELVKMAANHLDLDIDVVKCDATKELPFKQGEFDYIFQCGLLEHFDTSTQINLLKKWGNYGKNMISMIPNAASLAYRVGKEIMERNGTWAYGLEIPKSSMRYEFEKAGFRGIEEYSIGSEWATKFLPNNHELRDSILNMLYKGMPLDDYLQGYLIVTIGKGVN